MRILFIGTPADIAHYPRLRSLTTATFYPLRVRAKTIKDLRFALEQNQCTSAVITCPDTLQLLVENSPAYVRTGKAPTISQYEGSILHLGDIEILVIAPLEHLIKISYQKFLTKRMLTKLTDKASWPTIPAFSFSLIESIGDIDERIAHLRTASFVSVDIETKVGCEARSINCVGFTFVWCASGAPIKSVSLVLPTLEYWQLAQVQRLLTLGIPLLLQNGLYDNTYFLRWNIKPELWLYDTHILFHAWLAELPKNLGFISAFTIRDFLYWKDESGGDLYEYYRYCAKDTWATAMAWIALVEECPEWALTNYLINFPKVFPAITVALEGLPVSQERLENVKAEKTQQAETELEELRGWLGEPNFNPNSPLQVKQLFAILGCGHLPDTAAASRERAKAMHPMNELILGKLESIKKAKKLISTYLVPEKFWNDRLYCQLVIAATETNRRASKESSFWCGLQLQNIPRGDSVKQFIRADDGWVLNEWDKSNAESRATAHLSNEPAMIEATEGINDFHSLNASRFFAIPYEEIFDNVSRKQLNKALRDLSKRVNHGSNYQMGANVMLLTMGPRYVSNVRRLLNLGTISLVAVCDSLLAGFEKTYPRIRNQWPRELVDEVTRTGTLTSHLGWTRKFFGDMNIKTNRNALVAHGPQNLSVALLDEEIFQIWHASIYDKYNKILDFKKFYSFKSSKAEKAPVVKSVDCELRNRVRVKMQIHDSCLFISKPGDTQALDLVDSIMDNSLSINGRTLKIPHDRGGQGVYWSDLK